MLEQILGKKCEFVVVHADYASWGGGGLMPACIVGEVRSYDDLFVCVNTPSGLTFIAIKSIAVITII